MKKTKGRVQRASLDVKKLKELTEGTLKKVAGGNFTKYGNGYYNSSSSFG